MSHFLFETPLLDFNTPRIQELVSNHQWNTLNENEKILSIYNYVRDTIAFGYNKADGMAASQVIRDGYGQCNTKGILFMALLRAVGIPCRIHGFTIDKKLQKGALKGLYYQLSPKEILHSWVEVYCNEKWFNLEGFILDVPYLTKLQQKFKDHNGSFCGYGVATNNFKNPPIYWNQNDTYIQKEGIVKDLGVYESPDLFFSEHSQELSKVKNFIYKNAVRHLMNRNIATIREFP